MGKNKTRKCAVCNERIYPDRKHCIRHVPFKISNEAVKAMEREAARIVKDEDCIITPGRKRLLVLGMAVYGDTEVFLVNTD